MTNGTSPAIMLADASTGARTVGRHLRPNRFMSLAAAPSVLTEKIDIATTSSATALASGCARARRARRPARLIATLEGERSRRSATTRAIVHGVSAICTHLGCQVSFNAAERSWDCPCHGSRFAPYCTVLQGPAVNPLERKEL